MTEDERYQKQVQTTQQATRFGDKVAYLRRKANLTQVQAAGNASGLSLTSWTAIEGGTTNPLAAYWKAFRRLEAIASTLDVTFDELIDPL